jgi:3-oxoacyl-[acyl-carrier protein] reductase
MIRRCNSAATPASNTSVPWPRSPSRFDRVFATNTRGQLFAVQHAVRHVFHHTFYAASKAAVEAMALNLAPELGQRGITINAIAPGGTITDMSVEAAPRYIHPDMPLDHDTAVRAMTALGRWAEPSEIAAAVAFLVSADASYITGRTIPVDGGFF